MRGEQFWRRFGIGAGVFCLLLPACSRKETSAAGPAPPPPPPALSRRHIHPLPGDVPLLQIQISKEGWDVLRRYEWKWGGNSWERTNVLATIREGATVYTNVALHIKGGAGSFRPITAKPALTLNFDKSAPGQRFHGWKKIHLNNSVQDPSYLSEQICREMFESAGVPAPRASHAVVELNERPLGLYVLVEGWNKQFLKRSFKNTAGNLYDGGFAKEITSPLEVNSGDHPEDRSALDALIEAAREPDRTKRLARLEKVLDVDRFLSFVAMEVMVAHWDGYALNRNNYRVFHDLDANRMVFLPHGLDQMFGTWRARPDSSITPTMRGLVARAVLQTPEGRRRYLERMSDLFSRCFDARALTNRVQQLAAKLRPIVSEEGDFAVMRHRQAVDALCQRITQRAVSIEQQVAHPGIPLEFDSSGSAVLSGWQTKADIGAPGFSSPTVDGTRTLRIKGGNGQTAGSWRKRVLLEEGHYQLSGRIKMRGVTLDRADARAGVGLRISGQRFVQPLAGDSGWAPCLFEFDLEGLGEVELICDFRATQGEVWFDLDSLKLQRR